MDDARRRALIAEAVALSRATEGKPKARFMALRLPTLQEEMRRFKGKKRLRKKKAKRSLKAKKFAIAMASVLVRPMYPADALRGLFTVTPMTPAKIAYYRAGGT